MDIHAGADMYLQLMADPRQSGYIHLKKAVAVGRLHCSQLPVVPVALWERRTHSRAGLLEIFVTLWEGLMLERLMKSCSLQKGPTLEKFVED